MKSYRRKYYKLTTKTYDFITSVLDVQNTISLKKSKYNIVADNKDGWAVSIIKLVKENEIYYFINEDKEKFTLDNIDTYNLCLIADFIKEKYDL